MEWGDEKNQRTWIIMCMAHAWDMGIGVVKTWMGPGDRGVKGRKTGTICNTINNKNRLT